jgi:hypothetical protein
MILYMLEYNHFHYVENKLTIQVFHNMMEYENHEIDKIYKICSVLMKHNEQQKNVQVHLEYVH